MGLLGNRWEQTPHGLGGDRARRDDLDRRGLDLSQFADAPGFVSPVRLQYPET